LNCSPRGAIVTAAGVTENSPDFSTAGRSVYPRSFKRSISWRLLIAWPVRSSSARAKMRGRTRVRSPCSCASMTRAKRT
jgi:hypothetical protein